MKKLLMICGLVLGLATASFAQQRGEGRPNGGPGMRMSTEEQVKQLDEKLKLSADQKTKLTALFTAQADAQKKMREEMQAGGDREAMRAAMTKMREENEKGINAILTADQQKAYKAMLDEQREQMQKRMAERGAPGN